MSKGKKLVAEVKIQLPAAGATPKPPLGPAVGSYGINIAMFCKEFNEKTKDMAGLVVPAIISIYSDRSFTFILKSPPVSVLLKQAAGVAAGSAVPNRTKVGQVTCAQVLEIARTKKPDLNCKSDDAAVLMVLGTARTMGITVT